MARVLGPDDWLYGRRRGDLWDSSSDTGPSVGLAVLLGC